MPTARTETAPEPATLLEAALALYEQGACVVDDGDEDALEALVSEREVVFGRIHQAAEAGLFEQPNARVRSLVRSVIHGQSTFRRRVERALVQRREALITVKTSKRRAARYAVNG